MRVLFVTKEYLPDITPPGLCIMHVQKALKQKGVISDVLMVGEKEGLYCHGEYGDVFSIQSNISFEKKRENLFSFLKIHIPMLLTWPIPSKKRVKDYQRVIKELNEKNHYSAIIGTMFPPDVCVACSAFEHFYYYELDSLINNPMYKVGFKKYLKHRLIKLEKKLFDKAELIIHLRNNELFYSKEKYKSYDGKTVYTDIPYLTDKSKMNTTSLMNKAIDDNRILMVYAGLLSKDYRQPYKLIEMIKLLSNKLNIQCLFFSRGDCEEELRQIEIETGGVIRRMGYVSQEELVEYTERADFLLDIGNRLSGEDYSLPSKVIEYIAMGKPIIHMNGINDRAISYLDKYGLAINVPDNYTEEYVSQEIIQFIAQAKGKRLEFSEIVQKFPENTPEYTANIIINKIDERNKQRKQLI